MIQLHDWLLAHGLIMYPSSPSSGSSILPAPSPVTLYPTPFPRAQFEKAIAAQPHFNTLYARVAADPEFLKNVMGPLMAADPDFTGRLWSLYLEAKHELRQKLSLGLVRSDYMLDLDAQIKQIEYNSISVSFGGLSPKVAELHRFLNRTEYRNKFDGSSLVASQSAEKLARGLYEGDLAYRRQQLKENTAVLFVVQENERNVFDQRHLEYALLSNHGVRAIRKTFKEAQQAAQINEETGVLVVDGLEISVVYYRTGYAPTDYADDADWELRLALEKSLAIKCPTILSQLSGAKKVQQILTDKEVLAQFLDPESSAVVSDTFVEIYPLDTSEKGQKGRKLALELPGKYVLKPQREGGGNNIYKEDIPGYLRSISESEWEGYVLMELIETPRHVNTVVRHSDVHAEVEIVSELGVFGYVLWEENGNILVNGAADYLLRLKFSNSDEGGVAAGFGCLDSVYLV